MEFVIFVALPYSIANMEFKSARFDFEPEITVRLAKAKIPIYEVPISYWGRNHLAGKKLTIKDSLDALNILFSYRFDSNDLIILAFFLFAVFLIYSIIAVSSHNHFQTFGWDLGYFDQIVWKLNRLQYPFSTLNNVNFLANHFSPVLLVNAFLYIFWSDPRMLLVAQSFFVVAAAYPLYLLAKAETKSVLFSFSIVFSFLFFIGTQWSILNEFHETTYIPLLLALFFLALNRMGSNWLLLKKNLVFLFLHFLFPYFFIFTEKNWEFFCFFFLSLFSFF